jgi:hypothetical protein
LVVTFSTRPATRTGAATPIVLIMALATNVTINKNLKDNLTGPDGFAEGFMTFS